MKTAISLVAFFLAPVVSHPAGAAPTHRLAPIKASAKEEGLPYASATTPIGTLLDDPAARAVVDRHIPNFSSDRRVYFARKLTLKAIQPMSQGNITDRRRAAIDTELARLGRR